MGRLSEAAFGDEFAPRAEDSPGDRARVASAIEGSVMAFCRKVLTENRGFFLMKDLTDFVAMSHTVAPDSPGRILRSLNGEKITYVLVSRSSSQYRVTWVKDHG